MKKFLFCIVVFVLIEGDNIIGDGLYVYHRGKHAVNELSAKVDEYYPRVQRLDSVMGTQIETAYADVGDTGQQNLQAKTETPENAPDTAPRRKVYYR